MQFTKDQLQVIESALEDKRENLFSSWLVATGDDKWRDELAGVLEAVRENLRQLKNKG